MVINLEVIAEICIFSKIKKLNSFFFLAIPFGEARIKVGNLIRGRIVVGHSLKNDFDVLCLTHPAKQIRDLAQYDSSSCHESSQL